MVNPPAGMAQTYQGVHLASGTASSSALSVPIEKKLSGFSLDTVCFSRFRTANQLPVVQPCRTDLPSARPINSFKRTPPPPAPTMSDFRDKPVTPLPHEFEANNSVAEYRRTTLASIKDIIEDTLPNYSRPDYGSSSSRAASCKVTSVTSSAVGGLHTSAPGQTCALGYKASTVKQHKTTLLPSQIPRIVTKRQGGTAKIVSSNECGRGVTAPAQSFKQLRGQSGQGGRLKGPPVRTQCVNIDDASPQAHIEDMRNRRPTAFSNSSVVANQPASEKQRYPEEYLDELDERRFRFLAKPTRLMGVIEPVSGKHLKCQYTYYEHIEGYTVVLLTITDPEGVLAKKLIETSNRNMRHHSRTHRSTRPTLQEDQESHTDDHQEHHLINMEREDITVAESYENYIDSVGHGCRWAKSSTKRELVLTRTDFRRAGLEFNDDYSSVIMEKSPGAKTFGLVLMRPVVSSIGKRLREEHNMSDGTAYKKRPYASSIGGPST